MNIDVSIGALYAALEPHLSPIIEREARNFHKSLGIDCEDAMQEARIALVLALPHYDYNRSRGGVKAFARRTIRNALCARLNEAMAQMRTPSAVVVDSDGNMRVVRSKLDSLEAMVGFEVEDPNAVDPEQAVIAAQINAQMDARMNLLRSRIFAMLSGRERDIFECQAMPSELFLMWMRYEGHENPTIEVIGRFFGLTKNEIDWSIHKIKRAFTIVLEEPEFVDLIEKVIVDGRWPMVYMSGASKDKAFVETLIQSKELDFNLKSIAEDGVDAFGVHCYRSIENYPWGSVVHLYLDDERQCTLFLQGRFNHRTGELIGQSGHWKQINEYVPWYVELNRLLAQKSKANGGK